MTLIASYSIAEHPALVGDLLVSQWFEDPPAEARFNIPTHTDANRVLSREWGRIAVALRQKITVLSDDLAIAWSGSQLGARLACRELEAAARCSPLSLDRIKTILDGLELGGLELALLGLFVVPFPGGRHGCYRFAWERGEWIDPAIIDGAGAPVYALGTGAEHFLANFRLAWESIRAPETHRPEMSAILSAASILGALSGEQMRQSAGLVSGEMYGGGFEVATVVDGKVRKVDGITYYLLDAIRSENGRCMARFRRAISYSYEGDLLLVSTIELQWQCSWNDQNLAGGVDVGSSMQGEPAVYVIAPVHRSIAEKDRRRFEESPPVPTFASRYTVLYVHLPQKDDIVHMLVHYAGLGEPALGLELEGSEGVFSMRMELLARIARHL